MVIHHINGRECVKGEGGNVQEEVCATALLGRAKGGGAALILGLQNARLKLDRSHDMKPTSFACQ
jgi:hypothetical protein